MEWNRKVGGHITRREPGACLLKFDSYWASVYIEKFGLFSGGIKLIGECEAPFRRLRSKDHNDCLIVNKLCAGNNQHEFIGF
jgi:hypothetical protein